MNGWRSPLASLVLLAACADWASAQSQPRTVKAIGTCVVIQTNAANVETPFALRAVGSCETAENGGTQNCTAEIVPTGADIILDVTDTDGVPSCLRLAGTDPCAVVQNGPVIFQSPRHATQSFSAASDRVRVSPGRPTSTTRCARTVRQSAHEAKRNAGAVSPRRDPDFAIAR
jgi:hypothetical protein